jgi:hypothetical protein
MTKQTDKGTATGSDLTPLLNRATEAQMKAFNMDKELVRFMFDEAFYSNILRHLSKIEDTTGQVPTAGVIADKETLALEPLVLRSVDPGKDARLVHPRVPPPHLRTHHQASPRATHRRQLGG